MSAADWGIPTPSQGMPVTPLAAPFQAQGDALAAALDLLKTQNVPVVDNVDKRNALYPSPKQGNRCFRIDKGWEETYFDARSASNTGGASLGAGWYPTAGKMPGVTAFSTFTGQALTAGTNAPLKFTGTDYLHELGYNLSTGSATITQPGLYELEGTARFSNGSDVRLYIMQNSNIRAISTGQPLGINISGRLVCAKNDVVSVDALSSTAQSLNASQRMMSISYVGPA